MNHSNHNLSSGNPYCPLVASDTLDKLSAATAGLSINAQQPPPIGEACSKDDKKPTGVTLSMLPGTSDAHVMQEKIKQHKDLSDKFVEAERPIEQEEPELSRRGKTVSKKKVKASKPKPRRGAVLVPSIINQCCYKPPSRLPLPRSVRALEMMDNLNASKTLCPKCYSR